MNSGGTETVLAGGTTTGTVLGASGTQNVLGGSAVSTFVNGLTEVQLVDSGGVSFYTSVGGTSGTYTSGEVEQVYRGSAVSTTVGNQGDWTFSLRALRP